MKYFKLLTVLVVGWLWGFIFCVCTHPDFQRRIPEGSCNICLGYKAGENITKESFQFRFTIPDFENVPIEWNDGMVRTVKKVSGLWEYSATMTPAEYEVVFQVIERAKLYRSFYFENIDE